MQRKKAKIIIGILIAIFVCLIGIAGVGSITAHARNIEISGVGENDAIITDANGKVIPNGSDLSKWDNYTVDYKWGLPDGVAIQSGDTATVTFPHTAVGRRDVTFPLYDDSGREIGTFTIKEGENTGTITFNDVLASTATNREGELQFYVKGTAENGTVGLDWGINKIGWVAERNPDGSPSLLTWNIAFNPNSTNLGQTVITDNLGPGQSYVPGSVHAQTGKFDSSGNFVADGGSITPAIDAGNSTLIFTFENVTTAVNMTYHTKPDVSGTGGTWKNNATLNGQTVGSRIVWGGSGTGNGNNNGGGTEQGTGSVTLTKTDKSTHQALAGAVYDLQDATGKVIKAGLTTNAEGIITYSGLTAGKYQFVETKAPAGYDLNQTPIPFEITTGSTAAVTVNATDVKTTGPENPGTTTPPTTPTEPENPGTTTPPTTPTEPENPGTTTPNPEVPIAPTPTPSVKPPKPTKPVKPVKPTKPTKPTISKPGSGQAGGNVITGGAGGAISGQTTGSVTPNDNTGSGSENGTTGNGAPSGNPGKGDVGKTLPQTGERKSNGLILTLAGLALLVTASGLWYHQKRH